MTRNSGQRCNAHRGATPWCIARSCSATCRAWRRVNAITVSLVQEVTVPRLLARPPAPRLSADRPVLRLLAHSFYRRGGSRAAGATGKRERENSRPPSRSVVYCKVLAHAHAWPSPAACICVGLFARTNGGNRPHPCVHKVAHESALWGLLSVTQHVTSLSYNISIPRKLWKLAEFAPIPDSRSWLTAFGKCSADFNCNSG